MLRSLISVSLLAAFPAVAQDSGSAVWRELEAKRAGLSGAHQAFIVQQVNKIRTETQASTRELLLDFSGAKWREEFRSGAGDSIVLFDGNNIFQMDSGGAEYVRVKHKGKTPLPDPYGQMDWSKAVEIKRTPCGLPRDDRPCVLLETAAPLAPATGSSARVLDARARALFDTATGLMLTLTEQIQMLSGGGTNYQAEKTYVMKEMETGQPAAADLFQLPAGTTEVKRLARWDAEQLKKSFLGKPAPGLSATGMDGAPIDLGKLKGKTVLLDFWATWCPPCRADGPALDKLYAKYAGSLEIVGISVNEDRPIVEKFLGEHPHKFPIVLTTENDMPRSYQVGVLPTYIVIDAAGNLEAAIEGDQGFSQLKKVLKQAGMDTD